MNEGTFPCIQQVIALKFVLGVSAGAADVAGVGAAERAPEAGGDERGAEEQDDVRKVIKINPMS